MKLPFSLFLALKYMKPKRTYLSVVTLLSVLGVTLGVAVLIIVLSVMSGFESLWKEKILSFNAHLTITSYGIMEEDPFLMEQVRGIDGVSGAAPFVQGLVFIQHDGKILTPFMKGVNPELEGQVSLVPQHMKEGVFELAYDQVVIGADLARQLAVEVGDTILIHSPQSLASMDELHLPEELEVSGIFEMGMWQFDSGYILTSLGTARDLYGMTEGIHAIQVAVDHPLAVEKTALAITDALDAGYRAVTWKEQNRQLFGALTVEKNMMFFLLIFITVVAAFGITNTLITVAVQKTREIGMLRAIGFGNGSVMRVFVWQGLIQGLIGIAVGTGLGLLTLAYRNNLMHFLSDTFHLELFPEELYFLSEIPAVVDPMEIFRIVVIVLFICTLAGTIPAFRAARLDPVKALRYE